MMAWLLLSWPLAADVESRSIPQVAEQLRQIYGIAPTTSNYSLEALLMTQKSSWPQAWVTSTFYDWRTISKYRSKAGLHLGYDIAMPHGASVLAAWPGRVVQITPWYGPEYGVTVVGDDGVATTYGHIAPLVRVGDRVSVGKTLGTIASDHVDVKMQDASGRYIPFGEKEKGLVVAGRGPILVAWLVARNSLESIEEQEANRTVFRRRNTLELEQLKAQLESLELSHKEMLKYQREGLVSVTRVEQAYADLGKTKRRIRELESLLSGAPGSQSAQRQAARSRLKRVERLAKSSGYRWRDVELLVDELLQKDKSLRKTVSAFKRDAAVSSAHRREKLEKQVKKGRRRLATLKELYEMGGLSRQEYQRAQQQQELLEAEWEGLRAAGASKSGPSPRGK